LLGKGKIAPATEEGGAERNGAVRKMSGRGEQQGEGGKLRGGAGSGGRERAAAVQITLAIFGGGW